MRGGLEAIRAGVHAGFDRQYSLIEKAIRDQDPAAIETLKNDPRVPSDVKQGLGRPLPPEAATQVLQAIKTQLDAAATAVADDAVGKVRGAFATSITDIYLYAIILAILAWMATWLVPELPLRKTFDRPIATE